MTDNELLDEFLNGNEDAFRELVNHYQKSLYHFVWHRIGGHDEVADICQICFIQVYRKAGQFQGRASFKSWLYKIAINQCKNHYRSKQRQRIDQNVDPESMELSTDDSGWNQCLDEQKKVLIQSVIKRLPEKQRVTIELRFFQQCTLKQVAEIMECPVGTAKANYHHALTRLRDLMANKEYEYSL
jgi:RNA polymerase sigma-70 factor (ECF subfamily)